MGTVSPLSAARPDAPERSGVSVRVRVTGGRVAVGMYLSVKGDLAEAWTESEGEFDLSLDHYGPGRHAVTARAVDALGRWAGASLVVACAGLEPAEKD